MKILITTPIFPPEIGGPATYTLEVSRRLKERGHQIRVVTFTDSKPEVEDLTVIPVRLHYPMLGSILRQTRLFFTILRAARGMELIYSQGPVVVGLCSLIVGKLLRKPVVVKFVGDIAWENAVNQGKTAQLLEAFLHQPEGGLYITLLLRIQKFVFHRADKVITPSNYLKGILLKYYKVPAAKIEVVYNAVELKEVEAAGEKYGQPAVITIGRLVPWKGIDELIELVPALVEKYPDFKLLVVGDGPENDKLKKLCREIGAEPHVIFTGKVSHEQTLAFLKNSDVFVLNSRYEGLPHTVIEAMAYQCPVLATNIEGTGEALEDGRTGITVAPGNKQQLEEKLIFLLENERARSEMVVHAYENVKSKFTWENTLGQLERVLGTTVR
ncbi:MAG TPA: glycosyltransferase family 4 protein [Dehalococcoidales bacterium]|nr:glycosyltransferase family 4 protein [Dehalococcoidales bacterium]